MYIANNQYSNIDNMHHKTYIVNNTRFTIHILLFYMILKVHIANIAY